MNEICNFSAQWSEDQYTGLRDVINSTRHTSTFFYKHKSTLSGTAMERQQRNRNTFFSFPYSVYIVPPLSILNLIHTFPGFLNTY